MEPYKEDPTEITAEFVAYDEWIEFLKLNEYIREEAYREKIISAITTEGIIDPLTYEKINPNEIYICGVNYRETIHAKGLISRTRAILLAFKECIKEIGSNYLNLKIYSPEAITPFALYMRGKFPKFVGSEYGINREELFPIPYEDLCNLSFPDNVFDFVIVNDVFEHVPDLDKAISEIYRILKPKGYLLSTFPFAYMKYETVIKAKLKPDGEIQFLSPPEYHGNPIEPQKGSLVFQIPGWDILDKTRSARFSRSFMKFIISAKYGILAPTISGVFVLVARK